MVEVITFKQAIQQSQTPHFAKRHLLLGNGFSIACKRDIFTYRSLFEQADFTPSPVLKRVFKALGTKDFEHVIRILEDASKAVPVYSSGQAALAQRMAGDAALLKDLLISTVAGNHPNIPNTIEDEKFWACRQFLSHFVGAGNNGGRVYTLNYDLLLYWTLMHDDMPFGDSLSLEKDDGFGRNEDTEEEFVDWMGERVNQNQRIHYLHGALHLFDTGTELQKYTWINTGRPLLEQAREAMESEKFPLFVAEGSSKQKLTKIKHSAYLYHSYKSFSTMMRKAEECLFVFGHSLAKSDNHILKKISRGRIPKVFISIFGDPSEDANREIINRAKQLQNERGDRSPLHVEFYDADSAKVWEYQS